MHKNPDFNSEKESDSHLNHLPFSAYDGDEDIIFISYSHDDYEIVYKDIKKFYSYGLNIWYDEGIHTGTVWKDKIRKKIKDSLFLIVFLSQNAINSKWVRKEIDYALKEKKHLMLIFIEEFESPEDFDFGEFQAIPRYEMNEMKYYEKCFKELENKLNKTVKPPFPNDKDKKYIFVTYSPKDRHRVFQELKKIHNKGYPIRYKDGIKLKDKMKNKTFSLIDKSSLVVVFLTSNSKEYTLVEKHIIMAKNKILPIYLDDRDEFLDMDEHVKSLLAEDAIYKTEISDEEYEFRISETFKEYGFLPK